MYYSVWHQWVLEFSIFHSKHCPLCRECSIMPPPLFQSALLCLIEQYTFHICHQKHLTICTYSIYTKCIEQKGLSQERERLIVKNYRVGLVSGPSTQSYSRPTVYILCSVFNSITPSAASLKKDASTGLVNWLVDVALGFASRLVESCNGDVRWERDRHFFFLGGGKSSANHSSIPKVKPSSSQPSTDEVSKLEAS